MSFSQSSKIYVAGHRGLVGAAITTQLKQQGFNQLILRSKNELDLREQGAVADFFHQEKPEYVILAAAKVGGIHANQTQPAEFLYDNLMIQSNIIHASFTQGVKRLLFLGSSCIYPRNSPQPMKEEYLLSGALEKTNEAYAIAKIAGIKLCDSYRQQYGCDFVSVMPTNLYGPNDNFDLQTSHVLPALMRKFHEAKTQGQPSVEIWGSGTPLREFLHVDDMACACLYLLEKKEVPSLVNIGSGDEVSIEELALRVKEIVGYAGSVHFNSKMPDGTPRKLLDLTLLHQLGWRANISLEKGIKETYDWFLQQDSLRGAA